MIERAYFSKGAIYQFKMWNASIVDFLDGACANRFVSIIHKGNNENRFIINDEMSGFWGSEVTIDVPNFAENGYGMIWIRAISGCLELWTESQAVTFDRFTSDRLRRTRFMRHSNADVIGVSPASNMLNEDAARFSIAEKILAHRIEELERMMVKQ